jgi:hypothetical protein
MIFFLHGDLDMLSDEWENDGAQTQSGGYMPTKHGDRQDYQVIDPVDAIQLLQKKFTEKLAERDAKGEPAWLGMVLAYGYAIQDRLYIVDEDAEESGLTEHPYVQAARSMRLRLPVSKELRTEIYDKMTEFGSNPWFPRRVRIRGFRSPPPNIDQHTHQQDEKDDHDEHIAAPHC